ncbi:MAG: phosphoenolpyruvate synthase, partial [Gammaproteobacteria bacterium]|nr:phosphoenolpyruvate synthase [Gammaproteobacteria bacterium]
MTIYTIPLDKLGINDVASVGGKNASLGEMLQNLGDSGVSVPGGFATTADAYREFLAADNLAAKIAQRLQNLDVNDVLVLQKTGADIRGWIMQVPYPVAMETAIDNAYLALEEEYGTDVTWAVRSSATAEDLPDASFAGQQETYLNVSGLQNIKLKIREVFASLFNDRAIAYRVHQGFDHENVALSAGIQKMIRSDIATSGVMFTLDTESGFRDVVFITGSYGLGEMVVQGAVNPDEFYVHKTTLDANRPAVIRRTLGSKAEKMIYADDDSDALVNIVPNDANAQQIYCLSDEEVTELARMAVTIEKHYAQPMDIE